jgi:protein-S-isoprenylcysteine O-methyltransferase Ste14
MRSSDNRVRVNSQLVVVVLEERTLQAALPGYSDYMAQVKYTLVPYIW